ncbi:ABC transporter substrate-binding protein [Phenylobacterium sp. J426]|uniref:ABC transporter substrate-binding protein n=1 Tax=Phenylobacterium sp. J426 TaxID=2898439 RepID=UPI0021509E05|nr:ABC transporter substrate-binding protein [Phenylobacterium sp. J426]
MVRRRAVEGASPLTLAVVYPYSLHNYLLRTWLVSAGVAPDRDVRLTVAAPSRMAELLVSGVIEGFCAGEPWGTAAEAAGAGRVVARAAAILPGAPDKVLGFCRAWAEADAQRFSAVIRAVRRAAAWCAAGENRASLADLLAERLDQPAEVILPGLTHIDFAADPAEPGEASDLLAHMRRWGHAPADLDGDALARAVFRGDLCA